MRTAFTYLCACCLVMPLASCAGCHTDSPSTTASTEPSSLSSSPFKGKSVQASDLGSDYLQSIDRSSESSVNNALRSAKSLILDGTTVTIGDVRADRTVNLKFDKLSLINGARIITNGNNLVIVANNLDFNNNDGIVSFPPESQQASKDTAGADGGRVTIYAAKAVTGLLKVSLSGQKGGDGSQGKTGDPGGKGPRGNNGVDGVMNCSHGGTNGGAGFPGNPGGTGMPGKQGGNGGDLFLLGEAARNRQDHFNLISPPGDGGSGGPGGAGGAGGPGGEGGSGSAFCGGGHGGDTGPAGGPGQKGGDGPKGTTSGKVHP